MTPPQSHPSSPLPQAPEHNDPLAHDSAAGVDHQYGSHQHRLQGDVSPAAALTSSPCAPSADSNSTTTTPTSSSTTTTTTTNSNPNIDSSNSSRKRKLVDTGHTAADDPPARLSPCSFSGSISSPSSPPTTTATTTTEEEDSNADNHYYSFDDSQSAATALANSASSLASPITHRGGSDCDVDRTSHAPSVALPLFLPSAAATTLLRTTPPSPHPNHTHHHPHHDHGMTTAPITDSDASAPSPPSCAQPPVEPTPFLGPSDSVSKPPSRSQSPAKRLKPDGPTNATVDCSLDHSPTTPEPMDEDTAVPAMTTRDVSVDMVDADDAPVALEPALSIVITDDSSTAASSTAVTVTQPSTAATSTATSIATPSPPSLEEQIEMVLAEKMAMLKEGEIYYLVSGIWLKRFLVQLPEYAKDIQIEKEELEKELGPIDNTPIVDVEMQEELKKDASSPSTNDKFAEDFVPVKQGMECGDDYEVLPATAWNQLVAWYGLAKDSPIITRKAINTQEDRAAESNCIVEVWQPMFTVYRLRDPKMTISENSLREEKQVKPIKLIASTSEGFRDFLKQIKSLTGVETGRKVRLWKVTTPTEPDQKATKKSSKTAATTPFRQMVIDLHTFSALENGSELVDVPDNTNNPNYNGNLKIGTLGLGTGGEIVVEEQNVDGEWISQSANKTVIKWGETITVTKNGFGKSASTAKKKLPASPSRSASPVKSVLSKPAMLSNRGRERTNGRARGTCGLSNLGNTCYMNSALQCLRSVEELSKYFLCGAYVDELNPSNPLAHHGKVARAYAGLINNIFAPSSPSSVAPREFKSTIGRFGPSFSGYQQQDSQEFLAFLLDGMHEDLNRIMKKPYTEKPDSTDEMVGNPQLIAELAERHWDIYKKRNDSAVADLFGGLYKSTLVCPECQKVSITFDPFMDLTLPLPIESFFTKEFFFWPKDPKHRTPFKFGVELPKNSSIGALKEYTGKKFGVDPKQIMCSEVYKGRFYKHYQDYNAITDISTGDDVMLYELDKVPTSWPGPKSRSMLYPDEQADAASTEAVLVPVLLWRPRFRKNDLSDEWFSFPYFLVLNQEEASDYDTILEKLVEKLQFLTTRDMYTTSAVEEEDNDYDGAEDAAKAEVKDEKDGENNSEKDGFVDITMEDTVSTSDLGKAEPELTPEVKTEVSDDAIPTVSGNPRRRVPQDIHGYFTLKIGKRRDNEALPTGWNGPQMDELLTSRMQPSRDTAPSPVSHEPSSLFDIPSAEDSGRRSPASQISDDDKLLYNDDPQPEPSYDTMADVSDDEAQTSYPSALAAFDPPSFLGTTSGTSSPNGYASPSRFRTPEPVQEYGPLIRVGESILVEFTEEGFDTLFGGKHRDDFRGKETWNSWPAVKDPELEKRRRRREERKNKGIILEDCLDEFAREEVLSAEDPWYCPRCKEHRRASKKFELWKCPDILVVHLKRFSSSRSFRDKIDAQIDCPIEGLDLSQRVGFTEGKPMIYDLIAVDNHYGGLGGGHYTAYVKNWFDGKWYYCDDASVREAHANSVVTPAAYLLFYRRRSDKALGGLKLEQVIAQHFPSVAEEDDEEEEVDAQQGSSSGISRENSPTPFIGPTLPKTSNEGGFLTASVGNSTLWGNSMPITTSELTAGPANDVDSLLPEYDDLDNTGGVSLDTDEGLGDETEAEIADMFVAITDSHAGQEDEEKVEDVRV